MDAWTNSTLRPSLLPPVALKDLGYLRGVWKLSRPVIKYLPCASEAVDVKIWYAKTSPGETVKIHILGPRYSQYWIIKRSGA